MDTKQSFEKRFALLIDADNVSSKYIKPITDELSKYGTVTYKRIYGDWTSTLHAKWKDALLENSITPIQQFSYTTGKNATDSAMIIDAMDILYTNSVEGFCIVSSDSDFTRLASRIRESGLTVVGMGEKKTPVPFRKACDIFTTLELLLGESSPRSSRSKGHRGQGSGQASGPSIEQVEQAVVNIITDNQNNGKSTGLGEVGSRLLKRYPDFDVRSYGTNQLTKLLDEFESVHIIKDGNSVAVVLTEGQTPKKSEKREEAAESEATQGAAAAESTEDSAQSSRKSTRRGRRGGARRRAGSNEAAKADQTASAQEPAQAEGAAPASATKDQAAEQASNAPVEDATDANHTPVSASADPEKPEPTERPEGAQAQKRSSRRRQSRRGAGQKGTRPSAASEPSTQQGSSGAAEGTAASAEKAVGVQGGASPERFVRQLVREAGAEGIPVSVITKRVRARFRTFKVRDLGFSQMRTYVASLGDIDVEKRGRDYVARLAD